MTEQNPHERLMSTTGAAQALGVTVARVQKLLYEGRVQGAVKMDNGTGRWVIPTNAETGRPVILPSEMRHRRFDKIPAEVDA